MVLPANDGVVMLRPPTQEDRELLLAGRDTEWERWLGPGSLDPLPTATIDVDGVVVGWIDADTSPAWLLPGEANVGYFVLGAHRGHGYATRAVVLLAAEFASPGISTALLVIDADNAASHRVARNAGARVLIERSLRQFLSSTIYALRIGAPTVQ